MSFTKVSESAIDEKSRSRLGFDTAKGLLMLSSNSLINTALSSGLGQSGKQTDAGMSFTQLASLQVSFGGTIAESLPAADD
jgi:hypothetical protein